MLPLTWEVRKWSCQSKAALQSALHDESDTHCRTPWLTDINGFTATVVDFIYETTGEPKTTITSFHNQTPWITRTPSPKILRHFHSCIIFNVLTGNITAGMKTAPNRTLKRVVYWAEHTIGCALPCLRDIYTWHRKNAATRIIKDPNYPDKCHFSPLPSGKKVPLKPGHSLFGNWWDNISF